MFLTKLGIVPMTLAVVYPYCGNYPVVEVYETRPGDSHPALLSDAGHPDVYYGLAGSSFTFNVWNHGDPNYPALEYKWITDTSQPENPWLALPADNMVTLETSVEDERAWFDVDGNGTGRRILTIELEQDTETGR